MDAALNLRPLPLALDAVGLFLVALSWGAMIQPLEEAAAIVIYSGHWPVVLFVLYLIIFIPPALTLKWLAKGIIYRKKRRTFLAAICCVCFAIFATRRLVFHDQYGLPTVQWLFPLFMSLVALVVLVAGLAAKSSEINRGV